MKVVLKPLDGIWNRFQAIKASWKYFLRLWVEFGIDFESFEVHEFIFEA